MRLIAFDGVFNVYLRTVRSQIIPQEPPGKTTGLIRLINMSSVPASRVSVTFLDNYFNPLKTIGIILSFAFIAGIVLITLGCRSFVVFSHFHAISRKNTSIPSFSIDKPSKRNRIQSGKTSPYQEKYICYCFYYINNKYHLIFREDIPTIFKKFKCASERHF